MRSNADLERFAYIASHDLQEPLRMIGSYVQLIEKRYAAKLDADGKEFIGYAVDGAKRMQTMINDLLSYSRLRHAVKRVACPLEQSLRATLANLDLAIRDAEGEVTHEALPTVHADPAQMLLLLQNLIGNALKFRGDRPAKIHLSVQVTGGLATIAVHDAGLGIDPRFHQRIFEIFRRLHSASDYPGSGIGLAICRRIVESHGGKIWVESTAGAGSTFYFTLPIEQETGSGNA